MSGHECLNTDRFASVGLLVTYNTCTYHSNYGLDLCRVVLVDLAHRDGIYQSTLQPVDSSKSVRTMSAFSSSLNMLKNLRLFVNISDTNIDFCGLI